MSTWTGHRAVLATAILVLFSPPMTGAAETACADPTSHQFDFWIDKSPAMGGEW